MSTGAARPTASSPAGHPAPWDARGHRGYWGIQAAVFALLLLLAVWLSFPAVRHFTTAIPGPPADNFEFLWRVAWFTRAVFDVHLSPFHTDSLYYPFGYDLLLGPVTIAQIAVGLPLSVLAGEIVSYNTVVLLSVVLGAFGTYLLVFDLTGNRLASLAGGVAFGFCPGLVNLLAVGHFNLLGIVWLPYVLLSFRRVLNGQGPRWGLATGIFCFLIIFSDWYNVPMLVVALAAYGLGHARCWRRVRQSRQALLGAGAFVAILVLCVVLAVVLTRPLWQGGVQVPAYSVAYVDYISPSLDYFFVPRVLQTLLGQAPVSEDVYNFSLSAYVGLLAVVLAAVGVLARQDRKGRSFLWLAACSLLLALGPRLRWDGKPVLIPVPAQVERVFTAGVRLLATRLAVTPMPSYYGLRRAGTIYIPLPTLVLQWFVPFMNKMRYWGRFSVPLSFAVAVLAGLGVARIQSWATGANRELRPTIVRRYAQKVQSALGVGAVAALFLESAVMPYHIGFSDVRRQPVDEWLARDSSEFAIAEFPYARQGGAGPSVYRTLLHGKSICAGSPPFAPEGHRAAQAMLNAFPQEETIALLQKWGVKYVLAGARSYGQDWERTLLEIEARSALRLRVVLADVPVYHDVGPWNWVPGYDRHWPVEQAYVYELLDTP